MGCSKGSADSTEMDLKNEKQESKKESKECVMEKAVETKHEHFTL